MLAYRIHFYRPTVGSDLQCDRPLRDNDLCSYLYHYRLISHELCEDGGGLVCVGGGVDVC